MPSAVPTALGLPGASGHLLSGMSSLLSVRTSVPKGWVELHWKSLEY